MTHPRRTPARVRTADFLAGGGPMGQLIRSADWAATPLGPVDTWPQSLRTSVSILLASGFPMYIAWGPSFTQLYNDAYRPILGSTKHPGALGQSTRETFSEIWDFIGPMFERVLRDGQATTREDQMLALDRNGFVQECYFTFSYSAIRDETGGVGGVLVTVTETTKRIYGERRLRTLRELGATIAQAKTAEAACNTAADLLAQNRFDVPFALIYLMDEAAHVAHLRGAVGIPPGTAASPLKIDLTESASWPLGGIAPSSEAEQVIGLEERFGPLPGGPWAESPHQALVLPMLTAGQNQITGFFIAGISPRQMLDDEYRGFIHLAAGHLSTAIANASAREGATLTMTQVRRERDTAVRTSEERYRAYIEQTSEAVWRCEVREPIPITLSEAEQVDRMYAGAVLAECNDAMARQYGFERAADLVGAELKDLLPRSDPANVEYLKAFIRASYRLTDAESHEVDREGRSRYFLNNLLGTVEEGRLVRAWGSQRDITERKQAEQELRESEARFRNLADTAPVMIWISDADNQLTWFNRPWLEFTGRKLEDELGKGWLQGVHPDDLDRIRRADAAAFAAQRPLVMEYRLRRRDGSYRWVLDNGVLRHHPDGSFAGYIGSCIDISDRKTAEIAVLTSEDRYRSLAQASASIIWTADAAGRVAAPSPSWEEFTGQRWPDYRGTGYVEAIHPDDRERVEREWAEFVPAKRPCETRYRLRRRDQVFRHVQTRAVPILEHDGAVREWVGTVTDIEDQMMKEERLRLAERMETVGRLAGGIAHEANNQMSVVLGASHFVLRRDDIPLQVREDVEQIQRAAERTAGITQQLLAFSRRQMLQSKVLDLNALIDQARPLLQRTLGEQSVVSLRLSPTLGLVRGDPGQLEQVLLNLALNARDAMPRGGTLTIETTDVVLTEEYAAGKAVATIQPGPHVLLAVSDTGVGMTRETLARVFEPFFTTKEVGTGTGLGLATIYGIVKQSGGFIWAYSEPGSGSVFKVYLPAVNAQVTSAVEVAPAPTARPGERILVAEDDAAVRSVIGRTLRELGYTVSEVSDGLNALAAINPNAPPHLLITDVVMPRLSGRALAASLAQRWPSLPVLYMSGYTGYDVVARGLLDQGQPFIQKPVAPEALARKVRQLLDAAG